MGYVLLTGPVQLLQPYNLIGYCYSQFVFHIHLLAFNHRNHGKPSFGKIQHHQILKLNCLKLVAHRVWCVMGVENCYFPQNFNYSLEILKYCEGAFTHTLRTTELSQRHHPEYRSHICALETKGGHQRELLLVAP